jgi:hypothetical protein
MQVIKYETAAKFLDDTRQLLLENEAANAIILSYAEEQTRGVKSALSTTFYAVLEDDTPILPAMFTAEVCPLLSLTPYSQQLEDDQPYEAARILARYFFPKNPRPTGVNGPAHAAREFADEWERLTRCNLEIHHNARLYDCISVEKLHHPEGTANQATPDDYELVKKWRYEFRQDANAPLGTSAAQIARHIEEGRYYFWVTDQPVSMAFLARSTGNTTMIGAVYTPQEHRNHGYATAVTAALTQIILDSGKKYATLYTDLDNPTSNSIYQKIGYKPITDSTFWDFLPNI